MDWFLYDNDPRHERVKSKLYYFATQAPQRSFEEFDFLLHWKKVPVVRLICFYQPSFLYCP